MGASKVTEQGKTFLDNLTLKRFFSCNKPVKQPKMTEIDQIIDGVIAPEDIRESTPLVSNETENLRERLIGVAVAGKSKEYLGKSITSDEIGSLDQKELRKLCARYEAHMGGVVTNTMKKHFVTAYTNLVGLFLPKNLALFDREGLEESLNG